jgi:hypothetical protein
MSGFFHDPLQTINLIADNVRDRYRDETAVLKEIVQNADDAEADRVDFIVVSDGITSAVNRLLRGPALVAVNNGSFRRRDARGIRQFGLSVKSTDQGAIGKLDLDRRPSFISARLFCTAPRERRKTRIHDSHTGELSIRGPRCRPIRRCFQIGTTLATAIGPWSIAR